MADDPYNLSRFLLAQDPVIESVFDELRRGQKESHWMWFIFPQFVGLGYSATSVHFSIKSLEEADAYLAHPILGSRLIECCSILLTLPASREAYEIFGSPDDMKLKSSMTLFSFITEDHPVFLQVLTRYFRGHLDEATMKIISA